MHKPITVKVDIIQHMKPQQNS